MGYLLPSQELVRVVGSRNQNGGALIYGLAVEASRSGDAAILNLYGNLTVGERSSSLSTKVEHLLKWGTKDVSLNLAGVSYLDSSGVGELVSIYTMISRNGGRVRVLNPSERVREILNISGLSPVLLGETATEISGKI
jgi:anti-sigma B factor antagonist